MKIKAIEENFTIEPYTLYLTRGMVYKTDIAQMLNIRSKEFSRFIKKICSYDKQFSARYHFFKKKPLIPIDISKRIISHYCPDVKVTFKLHQPKIFYT